MRKSKTEQFYKPIIMQLYGYLGLIPFGFALPSLIRSHSLLDIVVYLFALLFILIILIANHFEPVIRIADGRMRLYNHFNNKPRTLLIIDYISYTRRNNHTVNLCFIDGQYEIKLNHRDMNRLIHYLEEIN